MTQQIVIIGAGECGGRAALSLRDRGFEGSITLIGSEPLAPYERPPLSKDAILFAAEPKFVAEVDGFASLAIDLRLGVSAAHIDRSRRVVSLSDGTFVPYDKLLLATGARPRALPAMTSLNGRVRTLRSHADAMDIRSCLGPGQRVAIIGGGFIGLELAASARKLGTSVTLIEGLPRILSRGVPAEIAAAVASRHRAEGVEILCDARIDKVEQTEDGVQVLLEDGSRIRADLVVVGIGSTPNTELAAEAGLAIDNGIAVDSHLQTSDPDIYAAGDCCSFPAAHYGGRHIRLESWRSAQEQGLLAAANMMGAQESGAAVPWFWSDQYDLTLQVAGLAEGATATVRRDLAAEAFILFHLAGDGRLLAASGIGPGNTISRDIRLAEMLIASAKTIDAAALAAPATKLKALLAA
ncbi:FAD-dependent oxidoreductase [Pararhizobium sp. BT-229]|uniref:NAD(P)/FAD-dependent oxidoreductase n=1 Tax=Pararhizobium sp. BT-229 TaxID=2986923 RepID=UPI0021F7F4E4|nr:FAD-dependent oxidoreductase [Pararhizobium sp. BT-229]MCV9961716.1 FAD-dependent oxidoreductase [Pararhizobium sp. BT-229]